MNEDIKEIQRKLMNNLERLDKAKDNISEEVARSNAVSQIANTYIKSCNLMIRFEEAKSNIKIDYGNIEIDGKVIKNVINNEEQIYKRV